MNMSKNVMCPPPTPTRHTHLLQLSHVPPQVGHQANRVRGEGGREARGSCTYMTAVCTRPTGSGGWGVEKCGVPTAYTHDKEHQGAYVMSVQVCARCVVLTCVACVTCDM